MYIAFQNSGWHSEQPPKSSGLKDLTCYNIMTLKIRDRLGGGIKCLQLGIQGFDVVPMTHC